MTAQGNPVAPVSSPTREESPCLSTRLLAEPGLPYPITIVVSLPTMVAFGMNVDLPFAGHPWSFLAILGLSLLVSGAGAFFFWKHDWLKR